MPEQAATTDSTSDVSQFSDFGLNPSLLKAVSQVGYETPSPIQAHSIPPLLAGQDMLGMAQTGTGKTAAFALPLLNRLDLSQKQPQLLVLTPTRELAIQVAEAMQTYARYLPGFHVLPIYGGQSMDIQLRQLKRGVHVVVGTPGRIQDHLRRKSLSLQELKAVVLDEADEMLRMGFIDEVENILDHTPAQKQVALFSATMPADIARVAQKYLKDPVQVRLQSQNTTVKTIEQRYWQVSGVHKLDALTRILEAEHFDGMIVFVRTRNATVELAEKLEARGYACAPLNGDMTQKLREQTVSKLKQGKLDILVGTDVVARGLDVERISHVINYDIPYDSEAYVHRIGRTGRAGRSGKAILFVSPRERRMLHTIEKATGQKIQAMQLPSREDIHGKRITQFKQLLADTLETQELDYFEQLIDQFQYEHNVGLSEVAAALTYLVQKERPLQPPPPEPKDKKRKETRTSQPTAHKQQPLAADMERYRLEVGSEHGASAKHIIGAIANEAGLESRYIHNLVILENHSIVDLPQGMPADIFQHLKKVRVCGKAIKLSVQGKPTAENAKRKKPKTGKSKPAKGKGHKKRAR